MTRINIDVPDHVHKQAKLEAFKNDQTLKEYVQERLEEATGDKD